VFNTAGEEQGFEYRADVPRTGKSGKAVKFDRPYGQVPCLNVNPTAASALRQGGPFTPLVIVEGVTRADALAERGVPAAAIMGIYGWKGDVGSGPATLSELHELPIKGREVWIFPDGDALTNHNVNAGVRALVDVFKRRGARSVSVGVVPDGLGLDDWLGSGHEITELQTLLRQDIPVVMAPRPNTQQIGIRAELPMTTDRDLAQAWLQQGAHVAYLPSLDSWTAFLNGRWQQDASGAVARVSLSSYLAQVSQDYVRGADGTAEEKAARALYQDLNSTTKLRAVQSMAEALAESHARDEDFDLDPWLFNCQNGTLDLRTGILKDHDPKDMLRGISPTEWDPEAKSPQFDQFLAEILPDQEVRAYLQMLMGMTLVGQTVLHVLPVFVGSGRNGKGTLVHALTTTLGPDYSGPVDKSLLISTKFESHPTKLMALKGKRLVTASETEAGDRFASASLKALTGGDMITARGMRQDQQSFKPSHSMLLMTNSLPEVDALDKALWARLKLFTFGANFEGREDTTIGDRLASESKGILRWLVEGVQRYLAEGLGDEPLGVVMATGDWRMEENSFLQYANERLVKDPKGLIASGDLIDSYNQWCQAQDAEPLRARALGAAIKGFGGVEKRTMNQRQWSGIRLRRSNDGTREDMTETMTDPVLGEWTQTIHSDLGKDTSSMTDMTDMTQNIGVSPVVESAAPGTQLPTASPMVPKNPPYPSDPSCQAPDQGKGHDTTPRAMRHGPKPEASWDRPMPGL
jgi:putative DNA primase/helicase